MTDTLTERMTMNSNLPAISRAERQVLKQFEAEISEGILDANQAAAKIGKALWDISDEQLYRATHATFVEYVEGRWQMSKSRAYRLIAIAKEVAAHPELPIPKQWQLEPAKVTKRVGNVPRVGHPDPEPGPPTIDAEGWDVDPPAALPVGSGEQPHVPKPSGVPVNRGEAEDEAPGGEVGSGTVPDPGLGGIELGGAEIWMPQGPPSADPVAAAISALVLLCENADLEVMGRMMTEAQAVTVRGASETLLNAYDEAHPPNGKRTARRSATPKPAVVKPPVVPKVEAPLSRNEVVPRFKVSKGASR